MLFKHYFGLLTKIRKRYIYGRKDKTVNRKDKTVNRFSLVLMLYRRTHLMLHVKLKGIVM